MESDHIQGGQQAAEISSDSDGQGIRRKRAMAEIESDGEELANKRAMAASGDVGCESKSSPRVVRHENPFFFWLAFVSAISLVMLFLAVVTRPRTIELLAMPPRVRAHFEAGKLLKVEVAGSSSVKAFVRGDPPSRGGGETALLLSGESFLYRSVIPLLAGRGIAAVAVDLPGAGLAEKTVEEEGEGEERELGFLGSRLAALRELLVEGFSQEREESEFLVKLRGRGRRKALALSVRELSVAVDQVVASLELAPVHLVAHGTSVEAALAWALENPGKVASVTLIDAQPRSPLWLLRAPVLGALIANSDLAMRYVLRSCCFASVTAEDAEDYGYLLRNDGGVQANSSMDVAEWAGQLEGVPKQILWASGWSKEWQREGVQLAAKLPGAAFHSHHGSRWPQEDAAPEIADMIAEFVKSVPSHRTHDEDFTVEEYHQQRHHSHEHELGYMEGLGQASGVAHGGWVL